MTVAVLSLEAALILRNEPLEIVEQRPVEDGPLRMPGTIDSRHGGRIASRNGPSPRMKSPFPDKVEKSRFGRAKSGRENINWS